MDKLIKLEVKLGRPGMWRNPNMPPTKHIQRSRPFVENSKAVLVHRIRRSEMHQLPGRRPHLSIHYWCGSTQCGSDKFTFHNTPPEEKLVCHRCELAAIEAGKPSSDELAGRHVCLGKVKAVRTCRHPGERE